MEQILKEILNKLEVMGKDISVLKEGQEALKTELKNDIEALRTELKDDITALKTELKDDTKVLKTELKNDIEALRTELKDDIKALRTELKDDIKDLSAMVNMSNTGIDSIGSKLDEQGLIVNRLSSTVRVNSSVLRNLQERIEYLEERVL